MVPVPRIRGAICATAHPVGCAVRVDGEIRAALEHEGLARARRGVRALVVGASRGYGLSARIALAFGCDAPTLGVFAERPPVPGKPASAGFHNARRFAERAAERGLEAFDLDADAFDPETVERCAELVSAKWGALDLLVWSLAAPRGRDADGTVRRSVLKPVGAPFETKTLDLASRTVKTARLEPASPEEIADTVATMGGSLWERWTERFAAAGLLAPGFRTVAFSYEGPETTRAIYRDGTIGLAKADLEETARRLDGRLRAIGGRAFATLNQALATQSSAAIPSVPLYLSILRKEMLARGLWEDCGAQMRRLFSDFLFADPVPVDALGRIRLDDRELDPEVQRAVSAAWERATTENLSEIADVDGYERDFLGIFGFGVDGVDYEAEVGLV